MPYQNFLLEAVNEVLTWDIPEEVLADVIKAQAGLMAGFSPGELMECAQD